MKKKPLIILFVTVLLDMIGLGIIIPFVPIIFKLKSFFPPGFSAHHVNIILGLLLASYPLAQFFGAPLLGRLSDNHGRKKILSLSLFGSFIGYLIFAAGIFFSSFWLLFLSRLVDGFTGGNISVAMASIADLSEDEKAKVRNFGMIGAAFGLGFIIGPAIGGILSDTRISPYFTTMTPFLAAAAFALANLTLVQFKLPETLTDRIKRDVSIKRTFINLKTAFTYKELKTVFIAVFLSNLGWVLFEYFFQVFLYGKFHLTGSKIAYLFVYIGFWIVISQGYVVRKFASKTSARKILKITMLPSAILLMVSILVGKTDLYFVLAALALFIGFMQPNFSALLSESSDENSQGEILGIRQSVVSASQFIAPLIGGFLLNVEILKGYQTPLMAGSLLVFFGWIVVLMVKPFEKKISFSKVSN